MSNLDTLTITGSPDGPEVVFYADFESCADARKRRTTRRLHLRVFHPGLVPDDRAQPTGFLPTVASVRSAISDHLSDTSRSDGGSAKAAPLFWNCATR